MTYETYGLTPDSRTAFAVKMLRRALANLPTTAGPWTVAKLTDHNYHSEVRLVGVVQRNFDRQRAEANR